jgi:hypothetical protein
LRASRTLRTYTFYYTYGTGLREAQYIAVAYPIQYTYVAGGRRNFRGDNTHA